MKELTSVLKSWFKIEHEKLIQQILITRRFHICKFVYSLKFICNPKLPSRFPLTEGETIYSINNRKTLHPYPNVCSEILLSQSFL